MDPQQEILKIVIIGPESTGKSWITQKLAQHFGGRAVPEYAREYLETHGTEYSPEDLLTIARGQIAGEEAGYQQLKQTDHANPLLFIDTDMYVMKVWSEFVFGSCHPWILDQAATRTYDAYLLCKPDIPWVRDHLREYPDLETREKLYHFYRDILINQSTPWFEVQGAYPERTASAIQAVEKLLDQKGFSNQTVF